MRVACKIGFALLATTLILQGGCAHTDPLDVEQNTPSHHSASYSKPYEQTPEAPSPAKPPLLKEGPLSLAQCIYVALENSPKLRSSWRDTRSSAATVGQALSRYYPQLEFNANYQRTQSQVLTEVDTKYLRSVHDAHFSVTQLILDGGRREANLQAAKQSLRSANFLHNSTLLDVALNTETNYYNLLGAQALLEVAKESLNRREHHVKLARRKYESGLARKVEVSQAEAQRADAQLSVVEARSRVRRARGQLAVSMGLAVSSKINIKRVPPKGQEKTTKQADALLDEAVENRPRLKAAAAELKRMKNQLQSEKAARWPTLQATGQYGRRDEHFLPEERPDWSIGLGFNLPIFTGFQRTYKIIQAREKLQKARADYENLLRNMEQEIWKAYSEVLRTSEAVVAARSFVESARENVQTSEKAYDSGLANITELIDAQTTFTRARNRLVTARLEQRMAIARLERSVGRSWKPRVERVTREIEEADLSQDFNFETPEKQ